MGGEDSFSKSAASSLSAADIRNTSDTCWGHDEYAPMDPILAEIWARLGQVAIILDKHARPDMYGDISMFVQNKTGQWKLNTGRGEGYPVPPGGLAPGYITWDGQLSACFNELDLLLKQLYKVSEMGPIFEAASGQSKSSTRMMS